MQNAPFDPRNDLERLILDMIGMKAEPEDFARRQGPLEPSAHRCAVGDDSVNRYFLTRPEAGVFVNFGH